jgi:hypothetical protein
MTTSFIRPALQKPGTRGPTMTTVNTSNDPMALNTTGNIINNDLTVLNSIEPGNIRSTGIKTTGLRAVVDRV